MLRCVEVNSEIMIKRNVGYLTHVVLALQPMKQSVSAVAGVAALISSSPQTAKMINNHNLRIKTRYGMLTALDAEFKTGDAQILCRASSDTTFNGKIAIIGQSGRQDTTKSIVTMEHGISTRSNINYEY